MTLKLARHVKREGRSEMRYLDGTEVRDGDIVMYALRPAVVEEVLDTPDKLRVWGLGDPV